MRIMVDLFGKVMGNWRIRWSGVEAGAGGEGVCRRGGFWEVRGCVGRNGRGEGGGGSWKIGIGWWDEKVKFCFFFLSR